MAINAQDLFNEQKAMEMLRQNVPMEMIIQQTGIPRQQLEASLTAFQNVQRPPVPSASPPSGIASMPIQPEVANVMPDNLGTDIADYLTDELGFDPATGGTVDKPSILQQLNQANATIALDAEDPNAAMEEVMNAQGEMSSLPEKDQLDIYRTALVDYYKEAGQKYKDLIKTPDEGLPFLVSGISLIESGEAGDNWMTALSKAGGKFAISKKQGQANTTLKYKILTLKT
jgi:hypothetical protein